MPRGDVVETKGAAESVEDIRCGSTLLASPAVGARHHGFAIRARRTAAEFVAHEGAFRARVGTTANVAPVVTAASALRKPDVMAPVIVVVDHRSVTLFATLVETVRCICDLGRLLSCVFSGAHLFDVATEIEQVSFLIEVLGHVQVTHGNHVENCSVVHPGAPEGAARGERNTVEHNDEFARVIKRTKQVTVDFGDPVDIGGGEQNICATGAVDSQDLHPLGF